MSQSLRYLLLLPIAALVSVLFQNCGQSGQISQVSNLSEVINDTPVDTPIDNPIEEVFVIKSLPSTQFICSPFGEMNQGSATSGLRAELSYINPAVELTLETKRAYGVRDYFNGSSEFIKAPTALFLTQINAPAQRFSEGFRLSDNTYLSNGAGEKLIEWFALHLQSLLKLSAQDEEGEYEFATISDDGSRVFVGSPLREIVNNDGSHATKMVCSTESLQLNRMTKLPLSYYYNQGPRTEIANVLLWRKKSDNQPSGTYKHCGKSDTMRFWNPVDSSPGEYVQEILADGWKVLGADNFELPGSQVNPCTTQNTNLISSAEFTELVQGSTRLNLSFVNSANIRANLYKFVGSEKVLVQNFDLSAQLRNAATLDLQGLENSKTYSVEFLIENPTSGTRVLNEVRFELVLKSSN